MEGDLTIVHTFIPMNGAKRTAQVLGNEIVIKVGEEAFIVSEAVFRLFGLIEELKVASDARLILKLQEFGRQTEQ